MLTVLGVLWSASAIAVAGTPAGQANNAQDQEWWLGGLHVTQAWQESEGSGITVAVLGTGVDASYPGLAGAVITGPDYTGSGRAPGSPFWGAEGTAVASLIAAHARYSGLVGVAPAAKILSVRVTLEFNDPLASDQGISGRLPGAIADGIRYATDHGARVIDLPLDPGTLGLTGKGDPAAAGGSPAEQAAVAYALGKGVVLIAPAGDDGEGPGIVNYPAAYPGVIAVGATDRTGHLASFSSRRSYASLTAPGVSLVVAAPPNGYGTISSTSTASGIVAGVAALVLSRFPHLTAAQVTRALIESTAPAAHGAGLPPLPPRSAAGAGYGTVDAVRAVDLAAVITAANQPHQAAPASTPHQPARHQPARHPVASPGRAGASTLAGSVLRDAVVGVGVLIVLLVVALLVIRSRRDHGRRGTADRKRTRGQHENRGPVAAPDVMTAGDGAGAPGRSQAARPGPPASADWTSPAGWQGGGIGEIRPASDAFYRPPTAPPPPPKSSSDYRTGRAAGRRNGSSGPPWDPAPEPARQIGPFPATSASSGLPPPQPGRGIRVPRDMASPSGATTEPTPPVSFDLSTLPEGFDLSTSAFGLTPLAFDVAPSASDVAPPASDVAPPGSDMAPPAPDMAPSASDVVPPVSDMAPPASDAATPGSDVTPPASDVAMPGSDMTPPASEAAPPVSEAAPSASDMAPPASDVSRPLSEAAPPASGTAEPKAAGLPTRQSLGFAAAPVPADYAEPPAELASEPAPDTAVAADPSYIWDLAATDVFPAATEAAVPKDEAPEANES